MTRLDRAAILHEVGPLHGDARKIRRPTGATVPGDSRPRYVWPMPQRSDGTQISQNDAITAWAQVARPYLIEVANAGTTVPYKALANHVREETGINTGQLIYQWIGKVLGQVSNEAEARGEPHLESLCVDTKGSIGVGYLWAPEDSSPDERDDLARQHRAECYARYAPGTEFAQNSEHDALVPPTEDDLEGVDEGGLYLRQHLVRERDRGLRKRKVDSVRRAGEPLECEVCGFDFGLVYGDHGRDYCEVHHRTPLHESGQTKTKLQDLAILCANCHRMIHRRNPWLTVDALSELVARP